jgi:hypothetical protein
MILMTSPRRSLAKVGIVGSIIMIAFLIADVATYSTLGVGFTFSQFANYLFGVTNYGNYIPGLYDGLLVMYVITLIGGVLAVRGGATAK